MKYFILILLKKYVIMYGGTFLTTTISSWIESQVGHMNPDFATSGLAQQELDDWRESRYGSHFWENKAPYENR
jgi:hypothetical protein